MTCYLIGYLLAYALTLYSTYLEEKWFDIPPMTPIDIILMLVCSLMSWFWLLVAVIFHSKLLVKRYPNVFQWFHKPIFKKPH